MADAAEAHATFASADTVGAIERLRSLTPNAPRNFLVFGDFEPLAVERMLLAELLLAQGDYGDAYEVASIFDHPAPVAYLPFLPRSLAIRERAAEALGDSERMAEAGMRLRALGWRESPSLIP